MKKALNYLLAVVLLAVLAFNSVYFRKLDQLKASSTTFDAKTYARKYFDEKLLPSLNNAIEINQLISLLDSNKQQTFEKYGHALGIGNIRYFLMKGEGQVLSINENDVTILATAGTNKKTILIATEFVFGNAIRDASGKIDINEFSNTMEFNNVSAEINRIVRAQVLPQFKATAKKGDTVQFAGAIELNKEHLNVEDIELMPVQLKIVTPITK